MNELRPAELFDVRDTIVRFFLVATLIILLSTGLRAAESTWKAGTAKAIITPQQPMWMAGYASRTRPADGTLHELYVRVLALEDAEGKRAVVVSNDLLGISRSVSENVTKALRENFGLSPDQVMLNASHTHSGPVLRSALYDAYPLDQEQINRIEAYSTRLEGTIVRTVGEALARMTPVQVSRGEGMTDFAVNRRNNREPDVPELKKRHALRGPTDHSVPVLAVRGLDGKLLRRRLCVRVSQHDTQHPAMEWRLRRFRRNESRDSVSRGGRPVLHGLRRRSESDSRGARSSFAVTTAK